MPRFEDPGIAISIAIILFGIAFALPYLSLGNFGLNMADVPTTALSIIRLGIISLGVVIAIKPIRKQENNGF